MTKKAFALLVAFMLLLSPVISGFLSSVHAEADAGTGNLNTVNDTEMDSNEHNSEEGVEVNNYENVREQSIKEDSVVEEGDFDVIEGDGELKYNDDGSVTFGTTSSGKNKIVYNEADEMENGIFEADIKSDQDLNRFGFIYRVQDASEYKYVGTGDQNNQYFSEIFGDANEWTSMTNGVPLEADNTYRLRVRFIDDVATLYIDGERIGSWSQDGVEDAGLFGFEKSRGASNITISNVSMEEYVALEPPETDPEEQVLSSDYMDVTIDETFPRVIDYNVDDKLMTGQETPVYGLKINDMFYYPEISFEKVSDNEAAYTMTVEDSFDDLDVQFTLSLKVEDNHVIYSFEDISNHGEATIEKIEFADMNLISVDSSQAEAHAKLTNISSDVTVPGDTDVEVNDSMDEIGTSSGHYTAFLTTGELSAGVWSSSEVDGYNNLLANRYEAENGDKAMGISSNSLFYHRDFMPEPSSNKPTIKIAIAEDLNDDDKVDWQDGAIAYRDIMQDIQGWKDVNNNVGTRIAMNFGSQAQQPFLKTLDNVKKTALATDGLRQPVLLKGYGNEGHDSAHPDYGDVGERMGGKEDLNTLIEEGHSYNAEIGVHINAQETYPEAKAFSEDLIEGPNSQGWGWIDQAYVIDKLYDLYSGKRAERLAELEEAAPDLDFVYLDVWHQDQWESNRITEQLNGMDLRLTTEFGTAMPNSATWQHWATDKNYGGAENKGMNSEVLRFIGNHQKDSWVLNWPEAGGTADHPLLGGFELAGFEGWQSDKNFDNFIHMTFDTNVPTKFLQKYYITNWETTDGDPTETNLEQEIKLEDPSNGDVVAVTRKDDSRERVITLNDNVVLDEQKYLIPWVEQDFETPTPDSEKLYHWNLEGGESTWTLPDEYEGISSVNVYKLTDQGRTDKQEVEVVDNQVTLTAEAATPYIIVAGDDDSVRVDEWSTDAHIHDSGFNSATIDDDYTTVDGDSESVDVIRTDQTDSASQLSSGDYYLNFDSPEKDSTISRTLTDLEPNEDYVAEVYVENNSDEKATIEVLGGVEDATNFTLRSLQKNYVKADSHAANNGYDSKMQRMQVSFTAADDTATIKLGREAGEGQTKFDDIRIIQKTLTNDESEDAFTQDFESVVQGIYPFVIGNTEGVEDNRIHLSEHNDPYTQKGWADNLVDDVIDGDWSLKINTGNSGLTYRTIPQHFHFEPGATYKVNFDYQTTADSYRFIAGDEAIDVSDIDEAEGLSMNEQLASAKDTETAEFTVTGSENGQTYIGIFNDGTTVDMHTKEGAFMLDNLRIEKIEDAQPPVSTISDLKNFVEQFEESGDFSSDEAVRALKLHITALEQYEETGQNEKVVKHLHGFKDLLDHYSAEEQISEEAYETLIDGTDTLIHELE
ncbi:endo-alpha-N-acetylgalactosaminidase [Virgibacillus sp. NKC19-3]|nr:endo-alpha-N-acetylgalactosaminidase [Virgibacillus sp. NKC19-3]